MKKNIRELPYDEIVTLFLQGRGIDPEDQKARSKYTRNLVERFQEGDVSALAEILRMGPHRGGTVVNEFEG